MFKIDTYSPNRILKVVTLGLMVSIIFSFKLWTSDREFLTFPIFDWLKLPIWLEYGLLGLFLMSLLYVIIGKEKERIASRFVILLLILLICLDQMRIQPWSYFFILLLIPFAVNSESKVIFNYFRYLFVILYVWSGVHKINPYFENLIFEDILIHLVGTESNSTWVSLSLVIPVFEILTGFFLLFNRTIKMGIYLAIIIHLCILYFIVFIVYGNFVIIPWNMTMIFLLMILGKKIELFSSQSLKNKVLIATLSFAAALPVGYIFGKVDQSLSFSLYDGKVNEIYMVSSKKDYIDEYHKYIFEDIINEGSLISFSLLAHEELKVPFYPENRFVKKLTSYSKSEEEYKLIQTKIPLWKINSFTKKNPEILNLYFGENPLPLIRLKEGLPIPKFEVIRN